MCEIVEGSTRELVLVTAVAGAVFTITRAQGDPATTANAFSTGAAVRQVLDKGGLLYAAACRVTHNANQAIANNSVTVLAFNTERFDTAGMHDTATNNSRITIPEDGIYLIGAEVRFEGSNTGVRLLIIRKNGTTDILYREVSPDTDTTVSLGGSTIEDADAADYYEVQVYQNSSLSRNALTTSASPEFWAAKLGAPA